MIYNMLNTGKQKGLPALLVYKNGDMIGNHLNVSDAIGIDCTVDDVEDFLRE